MSIPSEYMQRIQEIVGDDLADGAVNLEFPYHDRQSAKAQVLAIKIMRQKLNLLKKEISAEVRQVRSNYTTKRTMIGKGVGTPLMGALMGRRAVGRVNSVRRDTARMEQMAALAPYEQAKEVVETLLAELGLISERIKLSPEYISDRKGPDVLEENRGRPLASEEWPKLIETRHEGEAAGHAERPLADNPFDTLAKPANPRQLIEPMTVSVVPASSGNWKETLQTIVVLAVLVLIAVAWWRNG